jgi:hypothetical protein
VRPLRREPGVDEKSRCDARASPANGRSAILGAAPTARDRASASTLRSRPRAAAEPRWSPAAGVELHVARRSSCRRTRASHLFPCPRASRARRRAALRLYHRRPPARRDAPRSTRHARRTSALLRPLPPALHSPVGKLPNAPMPPTRRSCRAATTLAIATAACCEGAARAPERAPCVASRCHAHRAQSGGSHSGRSLWVEKSFPCSFSSLL